MSASYARGADLLHACGLARFPFLKEPKSKFDSEQLPRHMQEDMQTTSAFPKWVPRDCLTAPPSGTYAEFARKGFADDYEVPLSLVGHGGTPQKPAPFDVRNNKFTRPQYSYIHMPFAKLPGFIARLHPDDRYLAFLLTEDAQTVHAYFDIDGDFDKFPQMRGREEFFVSRFVEEIAKFFQRTFKRAMDLRGLLLLQASNEKKMSWHVHISTEAFSNVKQHKIFVQQFRAHLEAHLELELCVRDVETSTAKRVKAFHHVVDPAPYGANQNFRAPYNQKPGKNPLKPRKYYWYDDNRLYCQATPASDEIDVEVLFGAHPNLALPTRQGYVPLVMPAEADDKSQSRLLKRKSPSLTTAAAAGVKVEKSEGALTAAETAAVEQAMADELGSQVDFQELKRETDVYTGAQLIKGIARAGTSWCPHRTAANKAPYTHHSNRMRVQLEDGVRTFACFAPGCPKVYRPWKMDDEARRLLDPSAKRSSPVKLETVAEEEKQPALVRASPPPATTAFDNESDEEYW